jgi:hypothetical protein
MKLPNVIEAVLDCLYLAAELWEWLEKNLPVFKALARILVRDFNIHASGCMNMHQCNIQRLRFWCFFVMSVATFSRLAPETQPTPSQRCGQRMLW